MFNNVCQKIIKFIVAAYGREYVLKAEINHQTNDTHLYRGIKVRSCFAFNKKNQSYPLIDDRGCSTDGIVSRFMPSSDGLTATSMIGKFEVFKTFVSFRDF